MTDSEEIVLNYFQIEYSEVLLKPRFNICPSQDIPVILNQDGTNSLETLNWGLIPYWAKNPKPMINARAETAPEKSAFRKAFRKRRCLIPASGFFEWTIENGKKQPYYISFKNKRPIAFAGLWDEWSNPESKIIKTCVILTVEANSYLKSIHHRMPVILTPEKGMSWLAKAKNEDKLKTLLIPYDSENMTAWRVTRKVNVPAYDNPNCLKKLDDS